ncbi:MAG: hypothetical protein DWQ18_07905 [Crenarchaeota archaeon]|nr:MAG: hypothetical protein DWQ18_07905 [Thermoproteota archaeon]RDJ36410.1 MAG: hypothetical protein DWQ19_07415 [Thermoproteota archaeon]RDJ39039.1 MAG: hypothetical protein DWQ13_01880 [Thermoproteota archaeon]
MTKQKTLSMLLVVSALAVGIGFIGESYAEVRTDYFASGDIRQGINSDTTDEKSKVGYYAISGLADMRNWVHVSMDYYPSADSTYEVRLANTSTGNELVLGELKGDDKRDQFSTAEDLSGYNVIKVFEISDTGNVALSGQSSFEYLDADRAPTRPN